MKGTWYVIIYQQEFLQLWNRNSMSETAGSRQQDQQPLLHVRYFIIQTHLSKYFTKPYNESKKKLENQVSFWNLSRGNSNLCGVDWSEQNVFEHANLENKRMLNSQSRWYHHGTHAWRSVRKTVCRTEKPFPRQLFFSFF